MKKLIFSALLMSFILTSNLYAESQEKWNQSLYNSIRPAKDKGDSIVDIDNIKLALDKGANPNLINPQNLGKSVLSHFVEVISYSDNPETIEKGAKALDVLCELPATDAMLSVEASSSTTGLALSMSSE